MRVKNTAFLVERLAQDCAPLQYVRELTRNGIEAIEARRSAGWSGEGLVLWDADWPLVQSQGLYKLQCSDNGSGMTGPEIESNINQLSSSGRVQSLEENFGVGAKISAGVESPVGLVYKSWSNGQGVMATMWKDPDERLYGLKQFELSSGEYAHFRPIPDDLKPANIGDFGTAVALLGKSARDNTMRPDNQPSKWLIKYLNTRFYRFPDGVTVKVRDFARSEDWPTDPSVGMDDGGSQLRTIHGMEYHLKDKSIAFGSTEISDATVHWFVLPADAIRQSDIWQTTQHTAALYQDELYEFRAGKSALGRLREFGMVFGADRLVIYVEPNLAQMSVTSNTARSALVVNGEELPWSRWASEFRADLPQALKDLMNEIVSQSDTADHRDAIKRRLREVRELFKISRYRRTGRGDVPVGGQHPGGNPREDDSSRPPRSRGGAGGGKGGADSDIYAAFIDTDAGEPGIEIPRRDNTPSVRWVSVENGTRNPSDEMEDKAAIFLPESNMIQANRDFRVFRDMTQLVADRWESADEVLEQVKTTVEEWFEQQLIEAVMGVRALQGSPQWGTTEIEAALSPEALTAAVMPRYSTYRMITRALGAKLGAAKAVTDSSAS